MTTPERRSWTYTCPKCRNRVEVYVELAEPPRCTRLHDNGRRGWVAMVPDDGRKSPDAPERPQGTA